MTDPAELASVMDLVAAKAPALRASGVNHLSIGDVHVVFAAADPPQDKDDKAPEPAHSHPDPMQDPSTYPGGFVPTFDNDEDKPQ